MAGVSGFCRLRSPHVPGSSHAIGVCAPFTVWAVVPLLGGNNNKRHLVAGMSGFGRLPRTHVPGSSHAIGVSAPFTVWAVVPLLGR